LFSPTSFPCSAWYVTASLNVLETSVTGRYESTFHIGWFNCTTPAQFHEAKLFATRDDAIVEAERLLGLAEKRHEKATARLARLRAAVAKLKGGVA
jgi:hypothetical protein